jgi:hypothetical protein
VIKLTLNLAEKEKQIVAISKVKWCRTAALGKKVYRVGVSFLKIEEKDREILRSFIKSRRKTK